MFSALAYSAGGGVAQRAVRPEVVVLDAPTLDQHAGLAQAVEELAVQELAPQSLFRGQVILARLRIVNDKGRCRQSHVRSSGVTV